jgi:phage baseplate assembly protein gpV
VLPDVHDTVAVALPHGQPAGGIVLGSLYGTVEPHESGVRGNAVRAWSLRSKEGQRVLVDDDKRTLRVDNADGSFIELAPDTVRLHAATDLVIEAPGHGITVRADTVDFEHAGGL